MTWIEEIQQMGANLVSEFSRIAEESEANIARIEKIHDVNLRTLESAEDRVAALETRVHRRLCNCTFEANW
jgi:hypothetical protein